MRCLVVAEDDPGMRAALQMFLGRSGWEILTAGDGIAALELLRTVRPPVALVDIGLPKIDGLEVARRIRADGIACRLVAMSGFGTPADRDQSQEAGFDAHLVKPIAPAALLAALEAPAARPTSASAGR